MLAAPQIWTFVPMLPQIGNPPAAGHTALQSKMDTSPAALPITMSEADNRTSRKVKLKSV